MFEVKFDGCEQDVLPPVFPPVLNTATLEYTEQLAFTRHSYTVLARRPVNVKLLAVVAEVVVHAVVP
jgi:hypothetical protein